MNKKKWIVLFSVIIIILIFIIFIIFKNNNKEITLILNGSTELVIYKDSTFIDPGYKAYMYKSKDISDEVIINGNVDTSNTGEYVIQYTIGDITKKRTVSVIDKNEHITIIVLNGEKTMYLNINDEYVEPGYSVFDSTQSDLSDKVKISNNINTANAGTYKVIYSVTNNNNVTVTSERIVIVIDSEIIFNKNNINVTNDDVIITANITGNYYSHIILPNGTKSTSRNVTYKVSKNGTYKFLIYNNNGSYKEKSITIDNIDKIVDYATCNVNVDENTKISTINIDANDTNGIDYFLYNNNKYKDTKITINGILNNANIDVYDNVGNKKNISCSIEITKKKIDGWILIGDSRFEGMKSYISKDTLSNDNVTIIAKSSQGYDWFINTAINDVNNILKNNPDKTYYIYSNLGINGLSPKYASKLNELAKNDWKNHIVGFISVNPYVGSSEYSSSKNEGVIEFNLNQRNELDGVIYCDTYNGIGQSNFTHSNSTDTLHYDKSTSLRIYNYILKNCNF